MRVYILLFNARTENEGIHTLQIADPTGIRGAVRNKILMFEDEDDATRYALMLEAQDFFSPTVEEMDSEEIEEFCREADYDYEIIPSGQLAIPPETNLEQIDWSEEGSTSKTEAETEMNDTELDRIRRQLEGLL